MKKWLCLPFVIAFSIHAAAQTLGPPSSSSSSSNAPCSAFGSTGGTCAQGNDSRIPTASVTNTLSPTTPCIAWTPTDQSGNSLVFTNVNAQYCQLGNIVFAYGTLTYPSTVNASNAIISLPVAVPNQTYARIYGSNIGVGANIGLETVPNSSTAAIVTSSNGVGVTNATLTLKVLNFLITYPAF